MSKKSFQEWDHVMKNFNYSAEQASGDIAAMSERAMDAANGVGEGAELFDKLGVKVTDASGKMKSQEQIFNDTIKSLQGMEDVTERNAIASALLGTTGEELVPVLNMTNKELENMKGNASVISDEDLKQADKFGDQWNRLKNGVGSMLTTLGVQAMPPLQRFMEYGMDNLPAIQDKLTSVFSTAGDVIGWVGDQGLTAFYNIRDAIQDNGPALQRARALGIDLGTQLQDAFQAAKPALKWLGNTGLPLARDALLTLLEKGMDFYDLIKNNWSTIKPVLIGLGIAIASVRAAMVTMTIVQSVTGFLKAFQAATVASRIAMLGFNSALLANPITWVVAAVMGLIAAGVLLWKNWDKVSAYLTKKWRIIQRAVSIAGRAIKQDFQEAYQFVMNLFSNIGNWFMVRFNLVKKGASIVGTFILNSFKTAYNGIVSLYSGIGSWFSGIFGGVKGSFRGGVNTLISIANQMINKLNGISVNVPDWVPKIGGRSFGVSIPNIPQLAEGGITTGATLAMIGEGTEQEAVLPLSKLQSLLDGPGENTSNTYNSNEEQIVFQFNPEVKILGDANKEDVYEGIDMSQNKFNKMMENFLAQRRRKRFN